MTVLVQPRRNFYFQMLAELILKINLKLLDPSKIDSDGAESEDTYLAGSINEKNRIIFEDNELKKWYDRTDVSKI